MRFQDLTLPEMQLLSHKEELEGSLLIMVGAKIAGSIVRAI